MQPTTVLGLLRPYIAIFKIDVKKDSQIDSKPGEVVLRECIFYKMLEYPNIAKTSNGPYVLSTK